MRSLSFEFSVSAGIVFEGMLFAFLMGIAGGYFPARSASKMEIITTK